jgi:hypothetical protein
MKRTMTAVLFALALSGCAHIPFLDGGSLAAHDFREKMATSEGFLNQGDTAKAAAVLKEVCDHSSLTGVTDEALFRLAILQLQNGKNGEGYAPSRQLLDRLRSEFPHSQWTRLAVPVIELLDSTDELHRQNSSLRVLNSSLSKGSKELQNVKGLNQSLSKQNKDLQQTIERLKSLELELERKSH